MPGTERSSFPCWHWLPPGFSPAPRVGTTDGDPHCEHGRAPCHGVWSKHQGPPAFFPWIPKWTKLALAGVMGEPLWEWGSSVSVSQNVPLPQRCGAQSSVSRACLAPSPFCSGLAWLCSGFSLSEPWLSVLGVGVVGLARAQLSWHYIKASP